jgi:hypothetical protein
MFRHLHAGSEELADWLQQCGVRTIAMEPAGVYWISLRFAPPSTTVL